MNYTLYLPQFIINKKAKITCEFISNEIFLDIVFAMEQLTEAEVLFQRQKRIESGKESIDNYEQNLEMWKDIARNELNRITLTPEEYKEFKITQISNKLQSFLRDYTAGIGEE